MLSQNLRRPRVPPPANAPTHAPLLRLQQEMQPPHDVPIRCTTHSDVLSITGIPVICPKCNARRDWMLICYRSQIDIRCRCAHQWHEPELTLADFLAMLAPGGTDYPTLETAAQATGYDGTLTGTYFT